MEITKKMDQLKKSVKETEQLVDELISSLNAQKLKTENKEKKIIKLKEEVKENIEKIENFIKNYNANS